jgi:hypothetical protein
MPIKKILFICKGKLDKAVPIINIAQALNAEGNEIEIICSKISDGLENTLEKSGIKILSIGLDESKPHNILFLAFLKLQYWLTFGVVWFLRCKNQGHPGQSASLWVDV